MRKRCRGVTVYSQRTRKSKNGGRSYAPTPWYTKGRVDAGVVPALFGSHGLVADVGIDLTTEGWVAETQPQAGAGQIIQQRGCGNARDILAVEAEGLDDSIAQSRCFLTDRLAEALCHRPLLIAPEGVLEERRQQPRTKQRPTQLTQRQRVQPLPVSQLHWCKPGVDHHEEDAGQSEGDG